jgi:hypothetical protein
MFRRASGSPESVDNYEHVVAVLPADNDRQLMMVISLFGARSVPQAIFGIGPPVGTLRVAGDDTLPARLLLGWRIRPSTRTAVPITAEEMVARSPL